VLIEHTSDLNSSTDVCLRYEEKGFRQITRCRSSATCPADAGRPHIFMTYYQSGTILENSHFKPIAKHVDRGNEVLWGMAVQSIQQDRRGINNLYLKHVNDNVNRYI